MENCEKCGAMLKGGTCPSCSTKKEPAKESTK